MLGTKSTSTLLGPFLLLLLVPACVAGANDGDDPSSADEALTGAPVGHYRLKAGSADRADRWIEEINLHADGSYEGNFGDDVSNLSGHHFWTSGTYRVAQTKGGSVLFFDSDPYAFHVKDGALELQFVGTEWPVQPRFTMQKESAPVAITFAADGSVSAGGPLVAGKTALVLYAASRAPCGASGEGALAGYYDVDGARAGFLDFGLGGAAKGSFRALMTIPEGRDVAFWFQGVVGTCDGWDSAGGKNFHFPIVAAH